MKTHPRFYSLLLAALICFALAARTVPAVPALAQEGPLPGEQLGLTGVSDFSAEWYRLYALYRDAIDACNDADPDMALTPLNNAEIPFILGSGYDLMNGQGIDGRFEGMLGFTNRQAFLEKNGALLSFGNEFVRDYDGFSIAERKGDLEREEGSLDLHAGHMVYRRAVTRGETEIERDYYEYRLLKEGGMILTAIWGDLYNFQGDEANRTEAVYMRMTEAGLDFFTARANAGAAFTTVALGEGESNPEEAAKAFEDAGFTIQLSGGAKDGAVNIR